MKIFIFLIGFIIGGVAGIVCMCLVQINRQSEEEFRKFESDKMNNSVS